MRSGDEIDASEFDDPGVKIDGDGPVILVDDSDADFDVFSHYWACPGSVDTQVRPLASPRVGVRTQWD